MKDGSIGTVLSRK